MMDLFDHADLKPPCRQCVHLDTVPINPDVHYCRRYMVFRRASMRVACPAFNAGAAA